MVMVRLDLGSSPFFQEYWWLSAAVVVQQVALSGGSGSQHQWQRGPVVLGCDEASWVSYSGMMQSPQAGAYLLLQVWKE